MSKAWVKNTPHYYLRYYDLVPEDDYIEGLKNSLSECEKLFSSISEKQGNYAYGPNKWSIKEVLQHVSDTERIFQYRSLCIARGEQRKLEGFDQEDYTKNAEANNRSLASLLAEFKTIRASSISLFRYLTEDQMKAIGNANGFDAQAAFYVYLISGHLRHHLNVIKEKYLSN
jgi:hypothetical protein